MRVFSRKNSIIDIQTSSMLGGFGSINHMIVTLRNNRKLLPVKPSYFKNKSYTNIKNEYYKVAKESFDIKKATPEQLKLIREKIISNRKKETRRQAIFLSIAMPLACYGLYLVFHNFSFGFPETKKITTEQIENNDQEKYLFLLEDGDNWLKKRNYYNAVFQYKKAVQLYPNDFDANYRLALGYSYRCQYNFEDCEIGKKLINKLEIQYPNNNEIKEVKSIFERWGE